MEPSYDLVVVGAGTGGCLAAKTAAENGLNVCLIESKSAENIGLKACGDAVGMHHFDNIRLAYPTGSELCWELEGVKIFSPDFETSLRIMGLGAKAFMVNRREFGRRLIKEALDAGVEFMDKTTVLKPIIENNHVVAVRVKGSVFSGVLKGRVFIDASGVSAVLRRNAPEVPGFERTVGREDLEIAYREIRVFESEINDKTFGCIYLSQKYAPGGYFWLFPKGLNVVNIGLGVQFSRAKMEIKNYFTRFINEKLPWLNKAKTLDGRGAFVPTRRPLDNMVSNGLLVVGDAACQVNPIHGGGIGPSMTAGKLAGETAVKALEKADLSYRGLWNYNVAYMRVYGAKQASLDVFRVFLQNVSDDELNYGMSRKLIAEEDVLKASLYGEVKLTITDKTLRFLRSIGKLNFLSRLRKISELMETVKVHYQSFPENPDGFPKWLVAVRKLVDEYKMVGMGNV
ncbi:geranylgeranyl reductase family protein [Candidatus Bathyarchaeota archaeon]|nr:geranylgeranyl reductase family protein [Candidatus Bathyarchaeota archaeon]MBS7617408.1 geranylgeranyl reductase family protein [Candidatus Bathyarchaeota archaeon]